MKPVLVLTAVGLCSALLLAIVNNVTQTPIIQAQAQMKIDALKATFPFEIKDVKTIKEGANTFYEILDNGTVKGLAVENLTEKGYGGRINILLSVSENCKIFAYKVLSHQETPGLGDKITSPGFKKQFKDKALPGLIWKVKKDGGFVDALTAATISSRAITDAIETSLKLLAKQYPKRCQ